MRPNIFSYATSELSQDAMICWLLAWADPGVQQEKGLGEAGVAFLSRLFRAHGRDLPNPLTSVEIRRQYENIDVLVVVNAAIAIPIEDKVGTQDRTEKLKRYVDALVAPAISYPKPLRFPRENILPTYVQTREQTNYRAVTDAGYVPLLRRDLIEVLQPFAKADAPSEIIRDFFDHLAKIEADIVSFKTRSLDTWPPAAWHGFFSALRDLLGSGDWGYVANPAGGFVAFWWHFRRNDGSTVYLQLEQKALCFRISVDAGKDRAAARKLWHAKIVEAARAAALPVARPKHFGHGHTMSVAVYDGDYRKLDSSGAVDLAATVNFLRKVEAVLDGV